MKALSRIRTYPPVTRDNPRPGFAIEQGDRTDRSDARAIFERLYALKLSSLHFQHGVAARWRDGRDVKRKE